MASGEQETAGEREARDGAVETFVAQRPFVFAIAYRMLGTVADAEDMVQETWLRWQAVSAAGEVVVRSPKDFLASVVTRLCIDQLRRARVQREQYIGPWLPEPLETAGADALSLHSELSESLSLAFLVLLERLTPVERAVFLLHDVFAYQFTEIAPIVGKRESACRQLARRARAHVAAGRPRFRAVPEVQERLAREFARACAEGNLEALVATLADDITVWADGGGKARAAQRPIAGALQVARYLLGIMALLPAGAAARSTVVNGSPAFVVEVAAHPYSVLVLDIAVDRIAAIHLVVNPDKLGGVQHADQVREEHL